MNDGESCELLDLSPAATSNLGIRTQQVAPAAPDSPSLGGDRGKVKPQGLGPVDGGEVGETQARPNLASDCFAPAARLGAVPSRPMSQAPT